MRKLLAAIIIAAIMSGCSVPMGGKPEPMQLPKQTPLTNPEIDEKGVIKFHLPDGKEVYNVFEVALQALDGEKAILRYRNLFSKGLIPELPNSNSGEKLTYFQLAALEWLENNKVKIKNDTVIWYYEFDNAYNDIIIKSPWPSAFGQAHVIKAFLYAYDQSNNKKYLDLAIMAANAYNLSIDEGGFKACLPDGSIFFEEVPIKPAPHILNGHMISTLSLLELAGITKDEKIKRLAYQGIATMEKCLQWYDTGYWSRYDLNPKKSEILFRFNPVGQVIDDSVISIDSIELINNDNLDKVILDIGQNNDFEGAYRVSGAEWTEIKEEAGNKYRSILDGRSIRLNPVPNGTIQNSYFLMQLPTMKFSEYSQVPTFKLKVKYKDEAKIKIQVEIRDINHGEYLNFVKLRDGVIECNGDKKWKTAEIEVLSQELGWYMGNDYQSYHVELLNKIVAITGNQVIREYALRWNKYLAEFNDEQENRKKNIKDFALIANGTVVETSSKFYSPPHDVSAALDGETVDDYAASLEGEWPAWFQLRFKKPIKITEIQVEWESKKNFGKEFLIEAQVGNKWVDVVKESNGKHMHSYSVSPVINNVSALKFTVTKSIGQQRILMRRFSVY